MIEKNWQELVKPRAIEIQSSQTVTTVIAEPLERGFGFTLGNALRRLLLSSLEGSAVTAVRIDGASAATAKIPGVVEELDDILLNLKEIAVGVEAGVVPSRLLLRKCGPGFALAGDILALGGVEIVNPEHPICTLEHDGEIRMELIVATGRGYVPAAMQPGERTPAGFIALDSLHSPVKKVSYAVEDARLGQVLDFDRLAVTIETNGTISGEQALAFAARVFHDQLGLFINFEEAVQKPPIAEESELPFNPALLRRIDEFELSVRSANCLRHDNIVYTGDLVTRTEQQMMLTPNFGRKSLGEIKTLLAGMGLQLGMDVPGWPPDNIDELARCHADVH